MNRGGGSLVFSQMQMKTDFFYWAETSKRTFALHLKWIFPTGCKRETLNCIFLFLFEVCH